MNTKIRVLVTQKLPEKVEKRLEQNYDARLNPQNKRYSAIEILRLADDCDAIISSPTDDLTADFIRELPKTIQAICCYSVGFDHVDLEAAKSSNIIVTITPEVLSDATAEIAMLLMLGAARRASEGEREVRNDAWPVWSTTHQLGLQVTGKRLGILGMGRIGQIMAKRARAFDMEIHYYNRRRLASNEEAGAIYHKTIEEFLPYCEFLSIHCPATPQTHHLLNSERISLLPDMAVVVNTARGSIVDDDALIDGLRSGKLFAAGLDVYQNEPNIDPRYRDLENTFLLPHVGSATEETRDAMGFRALDNLDAIFAGKDPRDRVV
ncbi:MAG TPA: D-glycerate dehydrogenase [Desulfopila sp.]|nr:D-glycerate dehydrogenase [Desulfopila sp.]